jgi:hypothetical protein
MVRAPAESSSGEIEASGAVGFGSADAKEGPELDRSPREFAIAPEGPAPPAGVIIKRPPAIPISERATDKTRGYMAGKLLALLMRFFLAFAASFGDVVERENLRDCMEGVASSSDRRSSIRLVLGNASEDVG